MSLSQKEEEFNQNVIDYKGIFYNVNPTHKFHEGGAHFKYCDLINKLQHLENRQIRQTNKNNFRTNLFQEEEIIVPDLCKGKLHIQIPSFRRTIPKTIELSLPKMSILSKGNINSNQQKIKVSKEKIADVGKVRIIGNDEGRKVNYYRNSSFLSYIINRQCFDGKNNTNVYSNSNVQSLYNKKIKLSRNYLNNQHKSIALKKYATHEKEDKAMKSPNDWEERKQSKLNHYFNVYQNVNFPISTTNRIMVKYRAGITRNTNIRLKKSPSCIFELKSPNPSYRRMNNSELLSRLKK